MLLKIKSLFWWMAVVFLTIPTFLFLIRPGYFPMQDDLQAFRLYEMDKCFQDLQIPCRWVPDAGYQYGYPQFNYYPPSVYYLGEIFHLFGFQFIDAVKLLFILGFLGSSLTMFLLLKTLTKPWPAFVGTALYTYVPYKAVEVYVRGAMSEFWSLVIFPFVFWSAYQLIKKGKIKYIGWSGISLGLLLITHNLMSLIFLPLVGVWCLILIYQNKSWRSVVPLFFSGLLGLGLAAFFTFPVLVEKPYAHLETLLGGYFDYRQHFVDLYQLFITNHWGYGSSVLGPGDDLALSTGIIQWVFALIAIILGYVSFKKNKKISILIFILSAVEILVLFIMHQRSSFIWSVLPPLEYLQFPWRFMAVSIFLLSLIGALGVSLVENKKLSYFLGGVLIASTVFLNVSFFQPKSWINISDKEKFSGKSWDKQLTISIFDYLPIYAKFPPVTIAPQKPEVVDGEAVITSYKKGSDYQIGEIDVKKEATIRLPLFDFPGMEVRSLIKGGLSYGKIEHRHDDCRGQEFCLGLISFALAPGNYKIEAKLTNTPVRTLGNIVSLVSVVLLIGIFVYDRKNKAAGR